MIIEEYALHSFCLLRGIATKSSFFFVEYRLEWWLLSGHALPSFSPEFDNRQHQPNLQSARQSSNWFRNSFLILTWNPPPLVKQYKTSFQGFLLHRHHPRCICFLDGESGRPGKSIGIASTWSNQYSLQRSQKLLQHTGNLSQFAMVQTFSVAPCPWTGYKLLSTLQYSYRRFRSIYRPHEVSLCGWLSDTYLKWCLVRHPFLLSGFSSEDVIILSLYFESTYRTYLSPLSFYVWLSKIHCCSPPQCRAAKKHVRRQAQQQLTLKHRCKRAGED